MSTTYAKFTPTREQAEGVAKYLARLEDPRELARISGIDHAKPSKIRPDELPSKAYIRSRCIYITPPDKHVGIGCKWVSSGTRGGNHKITDDEGRKIRAMAKAGAKIRDMSEALDIHPTTVRSYCVAKGIKYQAIKRGVITPAVHARLLSLHAEGKALSETCQALGFNTTVVANWEKKTGLRFTRAGHQTSGASRSRFASRLQELHNAGVSWRDACASITGGRNAVRAWEARTGLQFQRVNYTQLAKAA